LGLGASAPPITVTVNVAANAPGQGINQVSASAPGAVFATSGDPTAITALPPPIPVSPASGQTGVPVNSTLTWSAAAGASSYDVFFGPVNPPPIVANVTGTSYSPGLLAQGTIYYWRVVSKNNLGSATTPTLSFLTAITNGNLVFTAQPVDTPPGSPMPPIKVEVRDGNGNLVTGSGATITLTSTPAGVSATTNAVNGVATFSGLVLNSPGSYFLTATSPQLSSAVSNAFTIGSGAPAVAIDSPVAGILSTGTVVVSGWALDNVTSAGTAISNVKVLVDGTVVGTANYGISRVDACTAYPGRPGCPNVGYSLTINLGPGAHTITVSATDSDAVPATGSNSVSVVVQVPMTATRAGVFRNNFNFLEDSNGNHAYDAGTDRFFPSFTGPGGFLAGDVPVAGDWTGDGHAKVGVYRTSTGAWYLDANDNGVFDAGDLTYSFGGLPGDMPFVGDWSGLGKSCVGIYRSNGSVWLLDLNCNGVFENTPTDAFFPFGGLAGDVPVVGSWTGGNTRVGVVRKYAPGGIPQGNPFFWVTDAGAANAGNEPASHPAAANAFAFGGLAGDVFVTGDWYGSGITTAGVYRAGFWVLDAALPGAPQAYHLPGLTFGYGGVAGDVPLTGKW